MKNRFKSTGSWIEDLGNSFIITVIVAVGASIGFVIAVGVIIALLIFG